MQKREDDLVDMFGFMGNSEKGLDAEDGMVVFGFGREKNAIPLMNKNQIFYIGFYNNLVNESNFHRMEKWLQKTFY